MMYSRLPLAVALAVALSAPVAARDLANFDVTTANRAKAVLRAGAGVDALGRETFTWVGADAPGAAKALRRDPEALARLHLDALLSHAKRAGDVADTLQLRQVSHQRGGAALVEFEPIIDGVPVFREAVAMQLAGDGRLIAMRGPLPRTRPSAAKALPAFRLDARAAVAAALADYEFAADVGSRLGSAKSSGTYTRFTVAPGTTSKSGAVITGQPRARRVWFRTVDGLQPAWYVETRVADSRHRSADAYGYVISAVDGQLLFRKNQKAELQPYSYRVWAEGAPTGLPYPSPQGRNGVVDPDGQPSNNTIQTVPSELRTLANAPFSHADTDPWLPADATTTAGNNVRAIADLVAPDGLGDGDVVPATTGPATFDYSFDLALAPTANASQSQAATVQAFYTMNWLHDWFYDAGFTEADGNAQLDNYGRGGLANDRIELEAQDYDTDGNANMSTPADGYPPVAQFGLFGGTPQRDADLEQQIVAHEWAHYLSNRLIADASGLDNQQGDGLGEGWSDFVALLMSVKDEDQAKAGNSDFSGAYPNGAWVTGNSFYGIRRYPYSTDLGKNPLTLRHVADGVPLPLQPAPSFGADGKNNPEVHKQGEIWANALWQGYAALLNDRSRLSFAEAQQRMKEYLVAGLKLTPASPTMTEARDALLAAVLATGETEDHALLVAAFAKRGLGAGAIIPDRYSALLTDVVESNSTGAAARIMALDASVPTGCDADLALDRGETAMLTIEVANTGFTSLASVTVKLSASDPALVFPDGDSVTVDAIPRFGSRTVTVPVRLDGSVADNSTLEVQAAPMISGAALAPAASAAVSLSASYDLAVRSSTTDAFPATRTTWSSRLEPNDGSRARWHLQSENGNGYFHGDDSASKAINWAVTPEMATGSGQLLVTLNHRYRFEGGESVYDGGVVQASIDGGRTWQDLDPAAAGYGPYLLSGCCGNPMAGHAAFAGSSQLWPEFKQHVMVLGTTYANQPHFRLRFGVATDEASNAGGWDIDSVSIAGLADTPFDTIVPQAASCSLDSGKTLQGALSGTWYDPARAGEGVLVDFGDAGGQPVAFFSWYTYDDTGEQRWLVGNAAFADGDKTVSLPLIETSGTSFGADFDAADVVTTPWGEASLSFPDCGTMTLTYRQTDGEAGTLTLQRALDGYRDATCGTHSGTYYDPARAGEGVLVDFGQAGGSPVEFFSWYTYQGGRQQWLVGNGGFASDGSSSLDLISTSGARFGNGFISGEVSTANWGSVQQRFIDCDTLELSYTRADGTTGVQTLTRALQPLGDGQCH